MAKRRLSERESGDERGQLGMGVGVENNEHNPAAGGRPTNVAKLTDPGRVGGAATPGNSPPLNFPVHLEGEGGEYGMSKEDLRRGYASREMPARNSSSPDMDYFRDE